MGTLVSRALELVFPGRCLGCGERMALEPDPTSGVCAECRLSLVAIGDSRCQRCGMPLLVEEAVCTRCRPAPWAFASNVSVFRYAGLAKSLLIAMKSGGRRRLARLFSPFLARTIAFLCPGVPLVPVPPRPRGMFESDYGAPDAVELLVRELERRHGARALRLLHRLPGPAQKALGYEGRLTNLRGRIRVRRRAVPPPEVILIDDVFTTGATADACARALLEAGARTVRVLTLAIAE